MYTNIIKNEDIKRVMEKVNNIINNLNDLFKMDGMRTKMSYFDFETNTTLYYQIKNLIKSLL